MIDWENVNLNLIKNTPIIKNSNKNITDLKLKTGFIFVIEKEFLRNNCNFILNSNTTIHFVTNKNYLLDFKIIQETIHWGKASSITVKGKGNLLFKFKDTKKTLLLRNVYCIPELGVNLLFVSSIPNLIVQFNRNNKSTTLIKEKEILSISKEIRGLYYINCSIIIEKKNQNSILNSIHMKEVVLNNYQSKSTYSKVKEVVPRNESTYRIQTNQIVESDPIDPNKQIRSMVYT